MTWFNWQDLWEKFRIPEFKAKEAIRDGRLTPCHKETRRVLTCPYDFHEYSALIDGKIMLNHEDREKRITAIYEDEPGLQNIPAHSIDSKEWPLQWKYLYVPEGELKGLIDSCLKDAVFSKEEIQKLRGEEENLSRPGERPESKTLNRATLDKPGYPGPFSSGILTKDAAGGAQMGAAFVFGYEILTRYGLSMHEVMDAIRQGKLNPHDSKTLNPLPAPSIRKRVRKFSENELFTALLQENRRRRLSGMGALVPGTEAYEVFLKDCWHTEADFSWEHLSDSQEDEVKAWSFLVKELETLGDSLSQEKRIWRILVQPIISKYELTHSYPSLEPAPTEIDVIKMERAIQQRIGNYGVDLYFLFASLRDKITEGPKWGGKTLDLRTMLSRFLHWCVKEKVFRAFLRYLAEDESIQMLIGIGDKALQESSDGIETITKMADPEAEIRRQQVPQNPRSVIMLTPWEDIRKGFIKGSAIQKAWNVGPSQLAEKIDTGKSSSGKLIPFDEDSIQVKPDFEQSLHFDFVYVLADNCWFRLKDVLDCFPITGLSETDRKTVLEYLPDAPLGRIIFTLENLRRGRELVGPAGPLTKQAFIQSIVIGERKPWRKANPGQMFYPDPVMPKGAVPFFPTVELERLYNKLSWARHNLAVERKWLAKDDAALSQAFHDQDIAVLRKGKMRHCVECERVIKELEPQLAPDKIWKDLDLGLPGVEELSERLLDAYYILDEEEAKSSTAEGLEPSLGTMPLDGLVEKVASQESKHPYSFILDGDSWRITFNGKSTTIKNSKMIRYVVCALERKREEIRNRDLVNAADAFTWPQISTETDNEESEGHSPPLVHVQSLVESKKSFSEDELQTFKRTARLAYDLACESKGSVDEHQKHHEWAQVRRYLLDNYGLNVMVTKAGHIILKEKARAEGQDENARITVINNLKNARMKISKFLPELAEHLKKYLRPSTFTTNYNPVPDIQWHISH